MIEWLKLGVLLTACGVVLGVIFHGYGSSVEVAEALRQSGGFSSDGLSAGLFSLLYKFFVFGLYVTAIGATLVVVVLLLSVFGIITWLLQRIMAGLVYIRDLWRTSPVAEAAVMDTVVAVGAGNKKVTLKDILKDVTDQLAVLNKLGQIVARDPAGSDVSLKRLLSNQVNELALVVERVGALEYRTQNVEPPPPPPRELTPEERIAELEAKLAAATRAIPVPTAEGN